MIRAGIIGGAGYTAGELLRLLINHPDVEVAWVHSTSNAGNLVTDIHQGLIGETNLRFCDTTPWEETDVVFFCTPHGQSRTFIKENPIPEDIKIVDLSNDFRLKSSDDEHDFVYGLPEMNRKPMVRGAKHVANPGCFATAIQLALLPLAKNHLIKSDIHVTAITGSTGAGVKPSATSHYSWRNDNVSIYKPFRHQHLGEIMQTMRELQPDFDAEINFVPVRGCFSRGIMAIVYLDIDEDIETIRQMYEEAYSDHSFTFVTDKQPDLKDVVNTNKCVIHLEKVDGKLLITSVIDNLLKGASGTAVHNMNLLFGLSERTGLNLKSSAF
ncbi:MAG: N-acetyl-gamma-glutamyl-phosphate reductase [Muribaculaceae bacterium]|nr:N-acetyl-gamma-glutamyl-phosphate reductase [Muribaculaceae bacterium]MDE6756435.1 N-acetyl-gamma-glutamyl-phosphate reductase [Muribaculaceae bacterium]